MLTDMELTLTPRQIKMMKHAIGLDTSNGKVQKTRMSMRHTGTTILQASQYRNGKGLWLKNWQLPHLILMAA